jgi:hypothetical protein
MPLTAEIIISVSTRKQNDKDKEQAKKNEEM